MSVPERRKSPRATMERLAYINIEPANGGIVLNVSEQGLCFHSIAPVVPDGELRFSLLEQNRRIEAGGELAWMNESEKVGGIRFTDLSPEALEQVRKWTTHRSTPLAEDEPATSVSSRRTFPTFPERMAGPATAAALRPSPPEIGRRAFLTGFSGGLSLGLLVATLVTAGFLFHAYRHQVGESLIQVGLRLSARAPSQPQPASPIPSPVVSPKPTVSTSSTIPVASVLHHETLPLKAQASPPKAQQPETQSQDPKAVALKVPPIQRATYAEAAQGPFSPPSIAFAGASHDPLSELISQRTTSLPQLQLANRSNRHTEDAGAGSGPPPPMYFEVGKFKQELWARKATDELAHLGLPASITQKGRLWTSAYHVLVGPYSDPEAADRAHKKLASNGFNPRPYERGSRDFTLSSGVTLKGTQMSGQFLISWESYIPDAKVKFLQNDYLVTTVDGRWVDRGIRTERNAFVYQRNPDGSRILLEIRFGGMSKVLVFNNPS